MYNDNKVIDLFGGESMERNHLVNIGEQRFEKIRERKAFYIDKSNFIREWWDTGTTVTLITRPRRFGKTLNMSMLECFFSNRFEGRSDLFEGLSIWNEEKYRQLQGTFPVIFLSFANIKAKKYEIMKNKIAEVIVQLYEQNRFLLDSGLLSENEKEYYKSIKIGMEDGIAEGAVHFMAGFMQRYYDKDVIIILDEYDTPMQEAWLSGYWDEAVTFFKGFFNSTFKTNPYLCRGLITGITRISKESIFSDLNNLKVITTTSGQYATAFGFTEKEVFQALDDMGLGKEKQGVKAWYDGFTFGSYSDIYNPWSIASFIDNGGEYDTYWADTSGNGLVNSLIRQGNTTVKSAMEDLLTGGTLMTELNEQIVFNQLDGSTGAVWSLLLATGYLKVVKLERVGERKKKVYTLALTNMEVASMFEDMVKGWFGGEGESAYNDFIKALLLNDVDAMNDFMNEIALVSFSSFDTAKSASLKDAPERFYHGFVPKDREKDCAYIIEFKVHKPMKEKDLAETVANALNQIEEKQYEAKLVVDGFEPENIRKYGFAFKGKECMIGE